MNRNCLLLVFLLIAAMLFAGCGTSHTSADEEPIQEDWEDWENLTTPSDEPSAQPSANTIMPSLEDSDGFVESGDVTSSYQSTVLGTWDNEAGTLVYEFLSNENLYITDSSGNTTNYSYWFTETENQVLLHVFQNGQAEADRYSFTLSGGTLTLFDADTGSTAERLIRRSVAEEETIAAPTQTPSSSTSSAASEPAAAAVESESTAAPSPNAEEIPSSAQTSSAAESTPAPTASADEPALEEDSDDSDDVTLSDLLPSDTTGLSSDALQALPAITCALDAIREGSQFSVEDPDSFWAIFARYASQGGFPDEDGYYILTPEEAFACASEIFADLEELPECPEDSIIAIHEEAKAGSPERYLVLQGELSGVDIVSVTENSDGSLTVSVRDDSNAYDYLVVLDGSAIVSIALA